jgi:DNA repair protein RecN (Recombination protein N)
MDEPGSDGADKVSFMFNANKGGLQKEIAKIASGGELSRLMLAVKSLISTRNLLPTIIFDEIDAGVSGDIAGKVGKILRSMAANMQVIVITHLPQIAGKGDHHFRVYKDIVKDLTVTRISKLDAEGRVEEIAKLLSDEKVTTSAVDAAKELLEIKRN